MSWTEEKVQKLKELWGKGNTASQIAEIIGGISRNAVIGKAFRLGLERRQNSRKKTTQSHQVSSATMYRESISSTQPSVKKEPTRRREKFSFKKSKAFLLIR